MLLLLMRHGIAQELRAGQNDAARALTNEGEKKTHAAVRGLRALQQNVDYIATSPKLRALQTAQIAAEVFGKAEPQIWPELESICYSDLASRLKDCNATSVLIVGHEPDFSIFAAQLLTGKESGFSMDFKKSGVCALEIDWSTPSARATLLWHLAPRQLRLMANSDS